MKTDRKIVLWFTLSVIFLGGNISAQTVTIYGQILYQKLVYDPLTNQNGVLTFPANGVVVRLLVREGNAWIVRSETLVGADGWYYLGVPFLQVKGKQCQVRVYAESREFPWLSLGEVGFDVYGVTVKVLAPEPAKDVENLLVKVFNYGTSYIQSAGPYSITLLYPWLMAGSVNITHQILYGLEYIKAVGLDLKKISSVNAKFADKTEYHKGTIYIENTIPERFSDYNIIHELGHMVMDKFSKSTSPGGPHIFTQHYDLRLSWAEGFADFFACRVRKFKNYPAPQIYWAFYLINNDIEGRNYFNIEDATSPYETYQGQSYQGHYLRGATNEVAVAAFLWDVYDYEPYEDWDNYFLSTLAAERVILFKTMEAMNGARTTLEEFIITLADLDYYYLADLLRGNPTTDSILKRLEIHYYEDEAEAVLGGNDKWRLNPPLPSISTDTFDDDVIYTLHKDPLKKICSRDKDEDWYSITMPLAASTLYVHFWTPKRLMDVPGTGSHGDGVELVLELYKSTNSGKKFLEADDEDSTYSNTLIGVFNPGEVISHAIQPGETYFIRVFRPGGNKLEDSEAKYFGHYQVRAVILGP